MRLEERGKWRTNADETLRPSLAKETRERWEGMMREREGRYLGCGLRTRGLGAGGEVRNGVWGRHALKIERVADRGGGGRAREGDTL